MQYNSKDLALYLTTCNFSFMMQKNTYNGTFFTRYKNEVFMEARFHH